MPPLIRRLALSAVVSGLSAFPTPGFAADLFGAAPAALLRTETFAAEVSVGHLSATAGEYVYNVPGDRTKLSQLNWSVDHALTLGGRVTVRPLHWLSLRARGWTTLAADSAMNDFDWLAGFFGFDSWTHWSTHSDTQLAKGLLGDVSVAVAVLGDDSLGLTAIAGYRYMTTKWNARGGSFIYSTYDFRDTAGTFPDRIGIAYQQWWQTPYLGLGATMTVDDLSLTGEVIGSAWVAARDKDYHALRTLLFEEEFSRSAMIGASVGAEYRFSRLWSAVGRFEYQKYFEAQGGTKITDGATGQVFNVPKPGAGADAETMLLSLGVKARL